MRKRIGGGKGRGSGRGRGKIRGYGLGPVGYCICPQCGKRITHRRGVPCYQEKCPECNMPMMRQANTQIATTRTVDRTEGNAQQNTNITRNSTTRVRDIQFPQVDPKRCQGCGICVNHCPTRAISIKNGKAVINTSICKNCRTCMKVCPNNAIF